jgi:DNA mismatch repair protein MutS
MEFHIDYQTVKDLELFEKSKGDKSVFALFNQTVTVGGRECLKTMFSTPFTDGELIKKRISNIRFFQEQQFNLELNKEGLHFIEHYLTRANSPVKYSYFGSLVNKWFFRKTANEQFIIERGIRFVITVLSKTYFFLKNYSSDTSCEFLEYHRTFILNAVENSSLRVVLDYKDSVRFFYHQYYKLDYYFRNVEYKTIREILDFLYTIDAYKSISRSSLNNGFTLPEINTESNGFEVKGLFHPFLQHPVVNDFQISDKRNICFLTGPNMAGKSTFLKSIAVSIYLSHIGFPVPAKMMKTSVYNGMLTTINLSDNITRGYSHFYNEVLRVKYVAEVINRNSNIFIVFDELFRGTNVKDAFDASLSVIKAFSKLNKGAFAISTHIIEIADKLDESSIFFKYFEAQIINDTPHYNYKLKDGVTDERIGMYILKKEKVIETITGE